MKIDKQLITQFAKYFASGVTAFAVDAGLLLLFLEVFNLDQTLFGFISIANMLSVLIAMIVSYVLNRVWSFESTDEKILTQGSKFVLVFGFSYVLNQILFGLMANYFGLAALFAKVIVTAVQMVWNFFLYKFVVYEQNPEAFMLFTQWMFKLLEKRALLISLSIVLVGFFAFFPFKTVTIDEHNYMGSAYRLLEGNLHQPCLNLPGQFKSPNSDFCVYKYNLGTSIFLLPAAITSPEIGVVITLAVFALGVYIFSLILRQIKLSKIYLYLFALFPAFIYYSRTTLSEIYSLSFMVLIVLFLLKLKDSWNWKWGLVLGMGIGTTILIRYTSLIPVAVMLIVFLLQERDRIVHKLSDFLKTSMAMLVGGLPFAAAFAWININLYGSIAASGYALSGEQILSLNTFIPHLIFMLVALNIIYPGLLFAPAILLKAKPLTWLMILPAASSIVLYALGPNILFEGRILDLILGIRFLVPVIPLLIIAYLPILARFEAHRLFKLACILGIFILTFGAAIINYIHLDFLQSDSQSYPNVVFLED